MSLIVAEPRLILTLIEAPHQFADVCGFRAAPGLREFYTSHDVSPKWLKMLRESTATDPWRHGFFVLDPGRGVVVGAAGFKGPVDAEGMVEVAYGIVPRFEGRGLATDATRALVTFAWRHPAVSRIRAHTRQDNPGSIRVLVKNGFAHVSDVDDPDDGRVMRWECERPVTTWLFVYGTLRRSTGHPMHRTLADQSVLVGPATVRGELYRVEDYPGLILRTDGDDRVAGEVYEFAPERFEAAIRAFDVYEGIAPWKPQPHEYRRVSTTATLEDGRDMVVWTYEFNRPVEGLTRVREDPVTAWR